MFALVVRKTVSDHLNVSAKLVNLLVRKCIVVVSRLQSLLHELQQDAVGHVAVACGHGVIGLLKGCTVLADFFHN